MSLRLVIEHSPYRQPMAERVHVRGDLSIGRGEEADWRIEDPEMFISRKHCLISGQGDGFVVTDMSRGGLFIDGGEAPLGAGLSAPLHHGMRLRLGDVVIRVELQTAVSVSAESPKQEAEPRGSTFLDDDFFVRRPVVEPPPRPSSLPEAFDAQRERVRGQAPVAAAPVWQAGPDDGFLLDPLPSARVPPAEAVPGAPNTDDPWSWSDPPPKPAEPVTQPTVGATAQAHNLGWDLPPLPETRQQPPPEPLVAPPGEARVPGPLVAPIWSAPVKAPEPSQSSPAQAAPIPPAASSPAISSGNADLAGALLTGMGLDPAKAGGIGPAEMQMIGRRFRGLVEVMEQSLRTRAREKRNLRVAQTVIGSANVNPLKFLPTTEDMLELMVGPGRPGYLDADEAIAAAGRDLADHQLRSWSGLQSALRRMIDRFDPQEIEQELEAAGRLRTILAGGRSALLWQLYQERFKSIAKAAEDRFLGEVGRDFRDAYEGGERTDDDD